MTLSSQYAVGSVANRRLVTNVAFDGPCQVLSVCRVSALATHKQDRLAAGVMSIWTEERLKSGD